MSSNRIVVWYTREYIAANGVCEKTKYPVVIDGAVSLSGREYKRRVRRAEKNATQAKHEAARIVNNNFRAGRDRFITATLSEDGMQKLIARAGTDDRDALLLAMRHEAELWIDRARNRCKKAGVELRYFAVVSDLDGKTLEHVRPHIHVIANREAAACMEDAWKLGAVGSRKLYAPHHGDLTDLVEYMLGQTRQLGTEKRYIPSRNLRPPVATTPRPARNPNAELRVPKGCELIFRSEQRAGRPQKLRYYRPARYLTEEDDERDE